MKTKCITVYGRMYDYLEEHHDTLLWANDKLCDND